MANYSRESGSLFPDSLLDMNDFKDIDDTVKTVVSQYYLFMQAGNIDSALALKSSHPELKDYWVGADTLNKLKEEIQNIGIYAQLFRGTVVAETLPTLDDYDDGVSWIKPIELIES